MSKIDVGPLDHFVGDLYRLILRREPDDAGLKANVAALQSGTPLNVVLDAFLNGDEAIRARAELEAKLCPPPSPLFPADYAPRGEMRKSYAERRSSGFLERYFSGSVVLDVGFEGSDNPDRLPGIPHAIGIDVNYPGYDGLTLPFADGSVDTVFSSHCLEHVQFELAVIRDWYRVLKIGGFIVCVVPSQALYEKKKFLPSRFNGDHKRMYTPASLMKSFEDALEVNTYRVRHLREGDAGFDYSIPPEEHSQGCYDIELVIEKIQPPAWKLE